MTGNRLIPALLAGLLLVLQAQLWLGRGSMAEVGAMKRELQQKLDANAAAQLANERLASEVRDLQEGLETVEERARYELGMVRPDEIFVQIAR